METCGWELVATGSYGASLDREEAERAIRVLADPDGCCQVQGIPSGQCGTFRGNDIESIIEKADSLSGERWVYLLINPVQPGLKRCAKVGEITSRRWMLVDIDAVRPNTSEPSTEEEHEAARLVADKIVEDLTGSEWPAPVLIDSGNGWHLLWRIDLPNSNTARALLTRCLKKLAHAYRDEVGGKIDTATSNATQATKLPGSWARKGESTPSRPWRMSRMIYAPPQVESVTYEQLLQLAGVTEEEIGGREQAPRPTYRPDQFVGYATNGVDRKLAYAKRALDAECARVALARPGPSEGRNNALYRAAAAMAELAAGECITWGECEAALLSEGIRSGMPESRCRATIARAYRAGSQHPRGPSDTPDAPKLNQPPSASTAVPAGEEIIVRGSSIKPRKVEWLWPGRIPLGKLTTFAGVGGLGKTFVLTDVTARVTQGMEWPDAGGECAESGQVLFISGEDDPDDTLVPRMIEAGANLDKVIFLRTEVQDRFLLHDLKTLELALEQAGPSMRLVCIDPPTAYLGGVDDHKNAALRGLLSPLKSFAAKHRVAIIFNTHVNKGGGAGKVEAMMRVMGSVAWVNAVRAAHMFARDPEDGEKRFFVPMKMNLARERKGLGYRIKSAGETEDSLARVEWLGEVDVTADEAVNRESRQPRKVEAKRWLIERFNEKLNWPSDELFRQAAQDGVARRAVFDAKDALGIPKARKITGSTGNQTWVWWVPEDWEHLRPKGTDTVDI